MQYKKAIIIILFIISAALFSLFAGCSAMPVGSEANGGFSFIYMSDSQADPETGDYTAWGEMFETAARNESQPAFIMIGGDLVNDGSDQQEWDAFFAAGGDTLKKMKLYPAIGNHDRNSLFKTILELPENGPEGKKENFYSFDHGDAHFTVLDSNLMGTADPEDLDWLKNDLGTTHKPYKIVMFHFPAYPAIDIPKDMARAEIIRQHYVPVLEQAGVDLVLSGHQHVYMRTFPLLKGERNEDGIIYLMGNAGGKKYTSGSFDYMAKSIDGKPVYSIISVNKNGITIDTYDSTGKILDSTRGPVITREQQELTITVSGDGINQKKVFTFGELAELPYSGFDHIYSTINNWPTPRFYAARGITVRSILKAAGVLDTAQLITFRSPDSYEMSFTREQILDTPRFYYPQVETDSAEGAETVEAVIAYEYKEGADDMAAVVPDTPCLIIGQSYPDEHTNPAFVVGVSEIIVSDKKPQPWEPATAFPTAGKIAAGELVKLQHKSQGLVKIHYTLDGSVPSCLTTIYNPSTYQPELNKPIPIDGDTVIKAIVTGYGRPDSRVAEFSYQVN